MVAEIFAEAGKVDGIEVWRVENFNPVAVGKSEIGKFFEGDSYVLLKTKGAKNGSPKWDIHFWLGNQTSQDESGAAAILAVELDDMLGGSPVQHREAQDHESSLFLSYFPSGIRYLPGGVKSGFSHVNPNEPDTAKKLYQVKGKKNIRVRQIEAKDSCMNKGDCFILDCGHTVFLYYGVNSKKTERLKAISAANQIRDQDHAGRSSIKIIDESSNEKEIQEFFDELGSGSPDTLPEEVEGEDEAFERDADSTVSLYKVSDASGTLKVDKIGEKPLEQSLLNSDDCFILETITSGLFVWIGRHSTKKEKEEAMKKAEEFLKQKNYPHWTQITRVVEHGEPANFREYFSSWKEVDPATLSPIRRKTVPAENAEGDKQQVDEFAPDEGTGKIEVYRIENFGLVPVEKEHQGMFFGGDSYVIQYTYEGNKNIIYYWLGKQSLNDDKTSAALQSVILDNKSGGSATIVRVEQGSEPQHFNSMFRGKMIVFTGGRVTGFKSLKEYDTYDKNGTRLFKIQGKTSEDVRAAQMPEVSSSLDSDDIFALETANANYLWLGKGSNIVIQDIARNLPLVSSYGSPPVEVPEGEEPPEFWKALGGRSDYTKRKDVPVIHPQLFHFSSDKLGDEIPDYKKKDLVSNDVLLLKSGDDAMYVWVGKETAPEIKEAAKKFSQSSDAGLCILIHEGQEPKSFTSQFPDWNKETNSSNTEETSKESKTESSN